MLFRPLEYHRPKNVQEAISFLKRKGAVPICGGTDVLVEQNPATKELVDLSRIQLSYIRRVKTGVLIGATTSIRQIELSSVFNPSPFDILHDAVKDFGTIQIRNMASVGGNVCNGIPSADCPPPLIALDAIAKVEGPDGSRRLLLEKLYHNVRKLRLKRGEILTELRIPTPSPRTAAAFVRLSRSVVDISLVSAAIRITLDEANRVTENRIVLGAVAPIPLRAKRAEEHFLGKKIEQRTLTEVSHVASLESRPIDDVRATANYRREMVAVLVHRAIRCAMSRMERD
jgi:carbon-monoxide dehydrogenase medium subunit